jgi:hypothetical protein
MDFMSESLNADLDATSNNITSSSSLTFITSASSLSSNASTNLTPLFTANESISTDLLLPVEVNSYFSNEHSTNTVVTEQSISESNRSSYNSNSVSSTGLLSICTVNGLVNEHSDAIYSYDGQINLGIVHQHRPYHPSLSHHHHDPHQSEQFNQYLQQQQHHYQQNLSGDTVKIIRPQGYSVCKQDVSVGTDLSISRDMRFNSLNHNHATLINNSVNPKLSKESFKLVEKMPPKKSRTKYSKEQVNANNTQQI